MVRRSVFIGRLAFFVNMFPFLFSPSSDAKINLLLSNFDSFERSIRLKMGEKIN